MDKLLRIRNGVALFVMLTSVFWIRSGLSAPGTSLLDHTVVQLNPKSELNLKSTFGGHVILIVNTASACGFTPQYEGLEALYQKYKTQGLVVLGFPSNDFNQERKSDADIVKFCKLNYGVTFPIFEKISVSGDQAHPLYQSLSAAAKGQSPRWNFFKYLVDQHQKLVGVFPSQEKPLGGIIEQEIQKLLDNK